jgi:hypothetical protein
VVWGATQNTYSGLVILILMTGCGATSVMLGAATGSGGIFSFSIGTATVILGTGRGILCFSVMVGRF